MEKRGKWHGKDYLQVVIKELGMNPLRLLNSAFALMGIIPILVIFYVVTNKYIMDNVFLGNNGTVAAIAIFTSLTGFFYAYAFIKRMVIKVMKYSAQRKRSDDEKSAFVSNVSHEFKSPLAIVNESLGLILEGGAGNVSGGQKEILEVCKKNITRLGRLVIDLLDISKIEAGRMEIKREEVDLAALVNEIIKMYEREFSKKSIVLKKDVRQDIGILTGDRDKLAEVIVNLLNNAIKYTPPKGRIDIVLGGSDKEVRFEIADTGKGIPREDCGRIFNKFERISYEGYEGTGLGLPIARDLVELHQGRIWVESEEGRGSKFIFTLPRQR